MAPLFDYCPEPAMRRNVVNSLVDGMWYCVMTGLALPFVGMFAIRLGASDYMVGLLTSLPALLGLLAQLPGAWLAGRSQSLQRLTMASAFLHRIFFLFFALIPLLPLRPIAQAWVFVIGYALANFPGTVCGTAWQAMMGEMFPESLRGQIFGERNMLTGLVTLVFTALAGWFYDRTNSIFPWNYSITFGISFFGLMMSLYYLSKLRELRPASVHERRRQRASSLSRIGEVLCHRPFMVFTVGMLVFHFGLHLPAAVFTIMWVKQLNLPEGWIGNFSVVNGLAAVVVYRWLGRVADRRGNGFVLFASLIGFLGLPLLYAYAYNPYVIAFLQVLSGFAGAAFNLGLFNTLLGTAPEATRADYIAIFNLLMGISGFLLPMAGVALMDMTSVPVVMGASTLMRLLAVVWLGRTTFRGMRLRQPVAAVQ
ncbi:MAG: MFS transporter [Chloroflexota bacterium]